MNYCSITEAVSCFLSALFLFLSLFVFIHTNMQTYAYVKTHSHLHRFIYRLHLVIEIAYSFLCVENGCSLAKSMFPIAGMFELAAIHTIYIEFSGAAHGWNEGFLYHCQHYKVMLA